MIFTTWWQGLAFGVFNLVAMLAIAYAFTVMWKKYEDTPAEPQDIHGCHANGHGHH